MAAWLAARSDGARYGELVSYVFPRGTQTVGPEQVAAFINQDPTVSQQLTLWGQQRSSAIWGNLLVIPIAQSILYVEPLYIQAEKGGLPELKRVILAQADRIEMGQNLNSTLEALFGPGLGAAGEGTQPVASPAAPGGGAAAPGETRQAGGFSAADARAALDILRGAEAALQRGDWVAYGREMQRLRSYLESQAVPSGSPRAP